MSRKSSRGRRQQRPTADTASAAEPMFGPVPRRLIEQRPTASFPRVGLPHRQPAASGHHPAPASTPASRAAQMLGILRDETPDVADLDGSPVRVGVVQERGARPVAPRLMPVPVSAVPSNPTGPAPAAGRLVVAVASDAAPTELLPAARHGVSHVTVHVEPSADESLWQDVERRFFDLVGVIAATVEQHRTEMAAGVARSYADLPPLPPLTVGRHRALALAGGAR